MAKKVTNIAPIASNDILSASEDVQLVISAAQLLANDSDADGDLLELVSVGKGQHCSVSLDCNGNVVLKTDKNFSGEASFSYTVSDGHGGKTTAAVIVHVDALADAAKLTAADAHGKEGHEINLNIHAALTDKDGSETLQVFISGVPQGASLSAGVRQADGSWALTGEQLENLTITPPARSDADFSLTVRAVSTEASNGSTAESVETLHVKVNAVADAPVLVATDAVGVVNSPIALDIHAALTDTDGSEQLLIKIAGVPKYATLSAGERGENGMWVLHADQLDGLTLTPAPGSDRDFTLKVKAIAIEGENSDRERVVQQLHVTVNPGATNHNPVATGDSAIGNENDSFSGNVLANDSDPDAGSTLAVAVPGTFAGANGTLALAADGSYTYIVANADSLAAGQLVQDSFTYQAKDEHGALSASAALTISITGTNDAPVLDSSKSPVLFSINEDLHALTFGSGTRVASLVDFASVAGGLDNVTDSDSDKQLGIAITAADSAHGAWRYSIDSGANWASLDTVTDSSARLLAADAQTRIAFVPAADYNGTATITFRAWDQSGGSNGDTANTTANGGTTAFSVQTDTAGITVNPFNDAPILDHSKSPVLDPVNEDAPALALGSGTLVSSLVDLDSVPGGLDNVKEVDSNSLQGIAITAADSAHGAWRYSLDGGEHWATLDNVSNTSARLLAADEQSRIAFVPAADFNGTVTITFRAWDQWDGSDGGLADTSHNGGITAYSLETDTASITVNPVNDSPEFTSFGGAGANDYVFDALDGTKDTIVGFSGTDFIAFHGSDFAASNGNLYLDHDGLGGDPATLIAHLNSLPALAILDFPVV